VAFAVLTGASGLLLAVPPLLGVEVSLVLQSYAPLYLLPVAWAVFVLEYVGYSRVRSRPVLACLVGVPAASVAFNLLTWGREVGGGLLLVLSVGTIVALVTLLFAAGLAVGSVLLLLWTARRQKYVDWWSAILLAAGGSGPWFLTVAGFQTDLLVDGGGLPAVVPWAILGVGFAGCVVAFGTVVRREGLFERLPAPGNVGPDTVFEQLTEPVAVLDRNERIARANPAMLSTFRNGDGGLVGRGLDDVVGMNLPALRASPRFEFVTDGERREFEYSVSELTDQYDRVFGHAVLFHDVTEREGRKQRIEELNRTRSELEAKKERLDEFASLVSHDLRNPLTIARGSVELAEDTGDLSHLERAQSAHERMESLLEELLSLARAGVDRGDTAPVDLASVATDAWSTAQTGEPQFRIDGDLPRIVADKTTLRQALENLYRNAAEHGTDGVDAGSDGSITVAVGATPDGFYVADDGAGIPADERDQVFEHGYTTRSEGTGFGLSIVREIVEAHDWSITVTESEDGGARFEISGVESESTG